ncbi:hypothetical protein BV898_05580 [Hypsibius exemplaris]|uniref:HAT C-terminal dimerisation domain-containing protein n=1 Tax=Hypsibius exemplaris TaxID=2072580 RepID=A0A1W0WZA0_HYPEX|nr:hypothetical protein BV898_05580 [Hypsibius exemplaris]
MVKTRVKAAAAMRAAAETENADTTETEEELQQEDHGDGEIAEPSAAAADNHPSDEAADDGEDTAEEGAERWTGDTSEFPVDRAAKDYYQLLFADHEVATLKSAAGRSIRKYAAVCVKCERRVTSTDSFYGFRSHFQTKHPNELAPPENGTTKKRFRDPAEIAADEMVPFEVPVSDPVNELPWDRSGKEFFQRLFINHLIGKEQRKADNRMGTRYSAECKICAKRLTGLDGFFKFREHWKLRHSGFKGSDETMDGEAIEATADDETPHIVVSATTNKARPAKEYYNAYFTAHVKDKAPEPKPGCRRGCIRYTGECKLCGKVVQGTDSYFGFRAHFEHKHKDVQTFSELAEFVTFSPVDGLQEGTGPAIVDRLASIKTINAVFLGPDAPKTRGRPKKTADGPSTSAAVTRKAKSTGNFPTRQFVGPLVNGYSAQQKLNRNVALCVTESLIPPEALTSRCFDQLIKDVNGNLTWPSLYSLTETHLPDLRASIKSTINRDLATVPAVAVTVNLWPAKQHSFVSVVVHYVDDQWNIRRPVVTFKRCTANPSAKVLADSVAAVLKEIAVSDQVIYLEVNDTTVEGLQTVSPEKGAAASIVDSVYNKFSGPRYGKMLKELRKLLLHNLEVSECKVQLRDVVRTLEILLEESVQESPELSALFKKISNNPAVWKKSSNTAPATSAWELMLQKAKAASTFNWDASKTIKSSAKFSDAESAVLRDFLRIAAGFEELFRGLRQPDVPTVCDLIPFIYGLRKHLNDCVGASEALGGFAQTILELVDQHFEAVDDEEIYVLAAFLSPNYKLDWCKASPAEEKRDTVRNMILEKMSEMNPDGEVVESRPEPLHEPSPKKKRSTLLSFMGDVPEQKVGADGINGARDLMSPEAELDEYLREDLTTDESALVYWRRNKDRFRRVARLAESVLFVPSNGTAKARLFQEAIGMDGGLAQAFGAHLETIMFCHVNPEFVETFAAQTSG